MQCPECCEEDIDETTGICPGCEFNHEGCEYPECDGRQEFEATFARTVTITISAHDAEEAEAIASSFYEIISVNTTDLDQNSLVTDINDDDEGYLIENVAEAQAERWRWQRQVDAAMAEQQVTSAETPAAP